MQSSAAPACEFVTPRLRVAGWHELAGELDLDLASVVRPMMTAESTRALPVAWQGSYSLDRARAFIDERDAESPTLLVVDRTSGRPIGLVILFEQPTGDVSGVDLRIGYLLEQAEWGRGLAGELVAGLVTWARSEPAIETLSGGVDASNPASARALLSNGFMASAGPDDGHRIYELGLRNASPWNDDAERWDHDEATRAYAAAAFESLREVLRLRDRDLHGATVCDFGCGTGLLTELLAVDASRIDAVDDSSGMLEQLSAKVLREGWTHVRPLAEIPDTGDEYDLIVCSSVCGFLEDYPGTVKQLVTRLAPGGIFVQWDWERDDTLEDAHGLSRDDIRISLTAAGLTLRSVDVAFEVVVGGQSMCPLIGVGQSDGSPGSTSRR